MGCWSRLQQDVKKTWKWLHPQTSGFQLNPTDLKVLVGEGKFYNRFLARKPWVDVMPTWMMNLMKLFHSYFLFTWIFGFLALRNSHSGLGKFHYNSNDSSFSCSDLDLHLLHHKLRTSSQRPPDRSDGQTKHISRLCVLWWAKWING